MIDQDICSSFSFDGYAVKQIVFNRNEKCSRTTLELDFEISSITPHFREDKGRYVGETGLTVDVFPRAREQDYPFECSVTVMGRFSAELSVNMEESVFHKRLSQNGLSILFPYVRAMVSDITRMANVTPVILPSINIVEYLKRYEKDNRL